MLSIVIPLFNEEDNIVALQRELADALAGREHEIILVDDCSQDQTVARIDRRPEVRVLEFEKNTGQSAAMYAGIMAATGEIVARRTRWWRVYDFFWGLHIMDLQTREDTHNPWLVLFAGVSLLTTLMALILLPLSNRRRKKAKRTAV